MDPNRIMIFFGDPFTQMILDHKNPDSFDWIHVDLHNILVSFLLHNLQF